MTTTTTKVTTVRLARVSPALDRRGPAVQVTECPARSLTLTARLW